MNPNDRPPDSTSARGSAGKHARRRWWSRRQARILVSSAFAAAIVVGASSGAQRREQPKLRVPVAPAKVSHSVPGVERPGVPPPISRSRADAIVSTREQLFAAVGSGKRVIWIEESAQIDLGAVGDNRDGAPDSVLILPPNVTLASGRTETSEGGLLYFSRRLPKQLFMIAMGNGCRITGLRLRGPSRSTARGGIKSKAILVVDVADVVVDRNEIFDWPGAGVFVVNAPNSDTTTHRVRVTLNYMHHNLMCGAGYGVEMSGVTGYAHVDRNTFEFNRHHVAGNGEPGTGFVAELNFVLAGGEKCDGKVGSYYEQHFDMHGTGKEGRGGDAGETIDIRQNTIRGEQKYYVVKTRPAFYLRGTPRKVAYFRGNACAHDDRGEAVKTEYNGSKLVVTGNKFDIDTSLELGVGDFDGDGYQDVFQATGAVWAYSPKGIREWRYLNFSTHRTSELRLGDFDGNGKTDVFAQIGGRWMVSPDGVGLFRPMPASSTSDYRNYRFFDFNGDRKTDVFETFGGRWHFSSAGATQYQPLQTSNRSINELRFGDFDGDGKTDVFSFASDQWSVSYGATSAWTRLNSKISSNLGELVFADFNGDKACDVARTSGNDWQVSWGGKTPWQRLNSGVGRFYPINSMLIGDFDGDRKADALAYARTPVGSGQTATIVHGPRLMMSSGGSGNLSYRSTYGMR